MLLHAKNHTLAIGNTRMDYVSFGKGDKCLVMIPGLSLRGVKGAAFPLAYMYRIVSQKGVSYEANQQHSLQKKDRHHCID